MKGETTGDYDKLKRGLITGLIIVAILVVLLGLILGFNKLRGSNEGEEEDLEEGKTYY